MNSSVVDDGDSLATASVGDGGVAESTEVPGAGDVGSEGDGAGGEEEGEGEDEVEEDDTCEA